MPLNADDARHCAMTSVEKTGAATCYEGAVSIPISKPLRFSSRLLHDFFVEVCVSSCHFGRERLGAWK